MTALLAALERAGLSRADMEAYAWALRFINQGGSREAWIAAFDKAAEKLSGQGRIIHAVSGQRGSAEARQPMPSEGQSSRASAFCGTLAAEHAVPPLGNPSRAGAANHPLAPGAHSGDAAPAREPTPSQRAASLRVHQQAAITVLDTFKIDGKPLGDWTMAEARTAARQKSYEGCVLLACTRVVANAAPSAKLRDVVKVAEVHRAMREAEEMVDAA